MAFEPCPKFLQCFIHCGAYHRVHYPVFLPLSVGSSVATSFLQKHSGCYCWLQKSTGSSGAAKIPTFCKSKQAIHCSQKIVPADPLLWTSFSWLGSLDLDGHIVIWASSMEPKKPTNIDYINLLVLITLHLMAFGCELVRSHLYMLWVLSREERNKHTVMKILLILKVFT